MSVFATIATVCTMVACNDYFIDTAPTMEAGITNTLTHQTEFEKVWEDEKGLNNWLISQKIGETIFEIVSIDIETQEVKEDNIP